MRIIRLTPDYKFGSFNCEEPDLNDFLLTDAKEYASRLLAVTYLIESNGDVAAFFSISNIFRYDRKSKTKEFYGLKLLFE